MVQRRDPILAPSFADDFYAAMEPYLIEGSLRRIIPGRRNPNDNAAGRAPLAVEIYVFKGYVNQASAWDSGVQVQQHRITIYGPSVTGLQRINMTGPVVNPWDASFDASFGGTQGTVTVPTDTIPRAGDQVRFNNDDTKYVLGALARSDGASIKLQFNINKV